MSLVSCASHRLTEGRNCGIMLTRVKALISVWQSFFGGVVLNATTGSVKVLYIDDREDIRRVFESFMSVAVDIETEVLLASDGQEGLEMALREKPDVIFVDSKMPIMDGIEATRRLKADDSLCDVPVIMVSAHVDRVERQEEAEEAGVAFFMNKPFTPEELEGVLRRALGL
jgi:CheY-like chemotaxis protein